MHNFLKHHWGLVFIVVLLTGITIKTIHPAQFIAGWDNFSVSINPVLNFQRTLFATWRAYRGLGVPSDSEVTDLPRQIIYLLLNIFLPNHLLEQVYVLACLWSGVIGMYCLGYYVLIKPRPLSRQVFAISAAIFYLFNLSTLSSFYYPMPMFVTRYAFLPWFTILILKLASSHSHRRLLIFSFIFLCFLATPTYLTATVFFTILLIPLFILVTQPQNFSRIASTLVMFILINSFWILPFLDYTIRKSPLIPQASTFIDVNESQLNEAPFHFEWSRLITLVPNFLYIDNAKDPSTGSSISLHPDNSRFEPHKRQNWSLFLFPALYLSGTLFLILRPKQLYLRWVPWLIALSLFMLRKEYSPFGLAYDWLGSHIPFFKVVFRFGDSKFNALIALGGSLAAAYVIKLVTDALTRLTIRTHRLTATLLLIGLVVTSLRTYAPAYFSDHFISSRMYVTIPKAYQDIASYINQDPHPGRLLHLPYDTLSYWRPHTWGYFGSTFLAFMLTNPVLDRTFAPAGLANDYFDQQLTQLIINAADLKDTPALATRAQQLHRLLVTNGVRYLLLDETVNPVVEAHHIRYWGTFHPEDTYKLVSALKDTGRIRPVLSRTVNPPNSNQTLVLYQVPDALPIINTSTTTTIISPQQENVSALPNTDYHPFIQIPRKLGVFNPFLNRSLIFNSELHQLSATLNTPIPSGTATTSLENPADHAFQLYASQINQDLYLELRHLPYPFSTPEYQSTWSVAYPKAITTSAIQNLQTYAADWHTLDYREISPLRVSVGETVVPLPSHLTDTPRYLATITTNHTQPPVTLFAPDKPQALDLSTFKYTDNPNCFRDALGGYTNRLKLSGQDLALSTTNGTTCIDAPVVLKNPTMYLELTGTFTLNIQDHTPSPHPQTPSATSKLAAQVIQELPPANYFSVCLIHADSNHCLNNHHTFNHQLSGPITIPTARLTTATPDVFITVPTLNRQTTTLTLSSLTITPYKAIATGTVTQTAAYPPQPLTAVSQITVPKTLSPESFYFNSQLDAFRVYNSPCEDIAAYRTTKVTPSAYTLMYNHNCFNGVYQILPFNNNHFYLWQTDYHLLSGKYPSFSLSDPYTYVKQYASLYQGYPSVAGFKDWQSADSLLVKPNSVKTSLTTSLQQPSFTSASVFVYPQPGLQDSTYHSYTLTQNSPNLGAVLVRDMNIAHLPQAWNYLQISPPTHHMTFSPLTVNQSRALLPSFWKVTVSPSSPLLQNYLITFNQAWDEKWHLILASHPLSAFFAKPLANTTHVKVNGTTNGWIIPSSALPSNREVTLYFLYLPERYALLGWLITLTTTITVIILAKKKSKQPVPKLATRTS